MMYDRQDPMWDTRSEVTCVKGRSRRIVVVDTAESPIYESVIYIVRDGVAENGISAQALLQEASAILAQPLEELPRDDLSDSEDREEYSRVSRLLFSLSGVALALSGGILIYWFLAM